EFFILVFTYFFYIQENNKTAVTVILLLGFQGSQDLRTYLFCLFLLIYCGTLCGNLLIITLVSTSRNLHTPMYFFISQLSISDILLSTDIVPNLLHILLNNGGSITFIGCITQFYVFSASEAFECFLLALMSYDRYVAICHPLRYHTVMKSEHSRTLITTCWLFGFSIVLIYTITTAKMDFCGPNTIDHIFCDLGPLLELACSASFIVDLEKAFSTCSSHLIVVSIFYWTMFGVYIIPTKGQSSTISKILSLLYTVFTPLINPIIYSLRNEEIKKSFQEILCKCHIWKTNHNIPYM
ncbi:hypothetical protein GDO81_025595, partial [Engystomops pustulosus]